jgi:hypothetical protein
MNTRDYASQRRTYRYPRLMSRNLLEATARLPDGVPLDNDLDDFSPAVNSDHSAAVCEAVKSVCWRPLEANLTLSVGWPSHN